MALENDQSDSRASVAPPSVPYALLETSLLLSATSLADMRAFFILSASAGALTFSLAALFGSAVKPLEISQYLYWIAILSFLFSSAFAFYTVFFRTPIQNGNICLHWGADGFKGPIDSYVASHLQLGDPGLLDAQLRFLYETAWVCRRKHIGLRIALIAAPIGIVALIAAQILR